MTLKSTMECPHCDGSGSVPNPTYHGKQARNLRKKAGLSLREVGRRLGLSAAYVSDLELGRRGWSEGLMKRYVKALRG